MSELKLEKKHSLAIRWFHWLNFPMLMVMTWSGLLIYWAYDPYEIKVGGHVLFHFFPDSWYKTLPWEFRLTHGLAWHTVFMWIFTANGLAYVLYLAISKEYRHLLPKKGSLKESIHVIAHDLFLTKKAPTPEGYNGAQRFAYTGIVGLGLGSVITGFAIYKPVVASGITNLIGGYPFTLMIHFICMIAFILFFLVHVSQVARAGWNNFRSMVTGYAVEKIEVAKEEVTI